VDITFFGLKSCDTCRKSFKTLSESGHNVTYIDVRSDGVGMDNLEKFQCAFGKALINTRSTTWRNLSEKERARPALQLLTEYPTLMKRPVIAARDTLFLGWGKDVQGRFL